MLLTHPDIADAAVVGIPDDEAGEVPMAFLVAASDKAPTLQDIQNHVGAELSSYKQVERIAYVEAIPKSASGKILRRVLSNEYAN